MKHLLFFILIFLLTPVLLFSQVNKAQWLKTKFKNADTILLISHVMIDGSTDLIVDSNRNVIALPKLLVNNKINNAIVKEEKVLNNKAINSLIKILIRQVKKVLIVQGGCFVPRQSIIVIRRAQTSYIDLCFHCSSYETSKDLQGIPAFDPKRWIEFKKYFIQQG